MNCAECVAASCEVLGVAWSFGQNSAGTGLYATFPPKADESHDYAWSKHVGDCHYTPGEAADLVTRCFKEDYRVCDPVTKKIKVIAVMQPGTTRMKNKEVGFWCASLPHYLITHWAVHHQDFSVIRGDDYDLTTHNCCHATDHVSKLMLQQDGWSLDDTRGALDSSVYSLARIGSSLQYGVFKAVNFLASYGQAVGQTGGMYQLICVVCVP